MSSQETNINQIKIHPTAIIHDTVELGHNVTIGAFSFVGENCIIGDDTVLAPYSNVQQDTTIGRRCQIGSFTTLGSDPNDYGYKKDQPTELIIGDDNVIKEYCLISRGTIKQDKKTIIGNSNFIMNHNHIGHDTVVGNNVLLGPANQIAGHCVIESNAVFTSNITVHQFVRIGSYSMTTARRVSKDVPPFCTTDGNDESLVAVNSVGMKRNGFSSDEIRFMKTAFQTYINQDILREDALKEIKALCDSVPAHSRAVHQFLDFFNGEVTTHIRAINR